MAQSTKNVAAFKPVATGGVSYAPLGTALPTDASTALSATYKALGYVSEDGIQPSRDVSVDKVKAWGGDIVAALLTDDSQGFVFKLIEIFAAEANEFVYGTDNVTTTAATTSAGTKIAVQDTAYNPLPCVLVFDMFYQGKKARVVVPMPNISITGEDPYVDGSVSGYEVTVEALKDDSGVRAYRYYENDDKTAA